MRYHLCVNIEGLLRNYRNRPIKNMFYDENGNYVQSKDARKFLHDCKKKGWKVLPLKNPPCEGFDYFGGGCPGHVD